MTLSAVNSFKKTSKHDPTYLEDDDYNDIGTRLGRSGRMRRREGGSGNKVMMLAL